MRFRRLAVFALSLSLASCGQKQATPQVQVERAWVRLPAARGGPGAGYFTAVSNLPDEEIQRVSSPPAKVEMHESRSERGMAMMRPIDGVDFGGGPIRFEPGGKHLMLMGLDPKLRPGGHIALRFDFKNAPSVTVDAPLVGPGEEAPAEHAGH